MIIRTPALLRVFRGVLLKKVALMPARRKPVLQGSVEGLVQALQKAEAPPVYEFPPHFALPDDPADRADLLKEFYDLQLHRSREHWAGEMHRNLLAELATINHQIRVQTRILMATGAVAVSAKGGSVRSPSLDAMSLLVSIRGGLLKNLGLTESQRERDGEARAVKGAKSVISKAKATENDLLA